jgi:arylsulfatase A-like enzyme
MFAMDLKTICEMSGRLSVRPMTKPPNVLFITADQWRGDCLSALGHPCVKTPNLDRLAGDGVLFRQHYCQATPCGPSRASLHTGLYLHNHRSVVNGVPLDARHANVALEARKAGYDPALFGHTDVAADPRSLAPDDPALTSYEGGLPGMTPVVLLTTDQQPWLADLKIKGYEMPAGLDDVFRPKADFPGAEGRGPTFSPARYSAEDSNTAFLTNEAIKYISLRRDEPWFVHISYLSPHPPFVVPEPYHALYDPSDTPPPVRAESPEDEARQHPWLAYFLYNPKGTGFTVGYAAADTLSLSDSDIRQLRATYYGMMSEVDAHVGRLIEHLEKTGEYDNTLVVICSDHGEMLGDHWLYAKYGYFDQAFHIPLIVRDPRTEAASGRGGIVTAFTENVDVMPTIVDWIGCQVPVACDGESLLPFCRGEEPPGWRREVHWAYDFRDIENQKIEQALGLTSDQCTMTVIRDDKYKYVHFTALPPLFFDLGADPWEQNNLADDPAYQGRMLEYAQKMLSWRMNHDERLLANTLLTPAGPYERQGPRRPAKA